MHVEVVKPMKIADMMEMTRHKQSQTHSVSGEKEE